MEQMKTKNLSASQRLEGLEKAMYAVDGTLRNLIQTQEMTQSALKMLANKLDATVKLARKKGVELTDSEISEFMVDNNVQELKQKLDYSVQAGFLTSSEEVTESSFIVGREIEADTKKVLNPRIQIALSELKKEAQETLKGKRVMDVVSFNDNKIALEIEEIYEITVPSQEQAPSAEAQQ
jgi:phosphosulfolactate synthase (CoM biosynthesis protein A)